MKISSLKIISSALLVLSLAGTTALSAQGQGNKKPQGKPFLIQGKLPHLTGMVHILWDDEDLALTQEQQNKLLLVKKETMSKAKSLGKIINALEAKIVKASQEGAKPETLKESVSRLADLRAEATMVHLNCIYKTRHILTKEQLEIIE